MDEYSQGGKQRSLSPVGDKSKGRGKSKGKAKVREKEKAKALQEKKETAINGQKKALVAEAKAALTYTTQTSAQVRQKGRGKEKGIETVPEVTLLLLTADAPPRKKRKDASIS